MGYARLRVRVIKGLESGLLGNNGGMRGRAGETRLGLLKGKNRHISSHFTSTSGGSRTETRTTTLGMMLDWLGEARLVGIGWDRLVGMDEVQLDR